MTNKTEEKLREEFEKEVYSVPFDVSEVELYKERLWNFIQKALEEKGIVQRIEEHFEGVWDATFTGIEIVERIKELKKGND